MIVKSEHQIKTLDDVVVLPDEANTILLTHENLNDFMQQLALFCSGGRQFQEYVKNDLWTPNYEKSSLLEILPSMVQSNESFLFLGTYDPFRDRNFPAKEGGRILVEILSGFVPPQMVQESYVIPLSTRPRFAFLESRNDEVIYSGQGSPIGLYLSWEVSPQKRRELIYLDSSVFNVILLRSFYDAFGPLRGRAAENYAKYLTASKA